MPLAARPRSARGERRGLRGSRAPRRRRTRRVVAGEARTRTVCRTMQALLLEGGLLVRAAARVRRPVRDARRLPRRTRRPAPARLRCRRVRRSVQLLARDAQVGRTRRARRGGRHSRRCACVCLVELCSSRVRGK